MREKNETMRIGKINSLVIMAGCLLVAGCATKQAPPPNCASWQSQALVETLNALRNDITAHYGFRDGAPRVNLGPCGRFARDFRERWNARFLDPVNIAFIMSGDGRLCHHVLVRLPDGRYFDGGNGVVTEPFLAALYPGSCIEVMKVFDSRLLDQRSYGLDRKYPECENYSDEFTGEVIRRRFGELTAPRAHP
jgi:hypothetical protein